MENENKFIENEVTQANADEIITEEEGSETEKNEIKVEASGMTAEGIGTGGHEYPSHENEYEGKTPKDVKRGEFKEWMKSIIIAAFLAVIIMQLIVPTVVREHSMEPSFYGGDYIIVSKISYKIADPKRGDVIIFKSDIPINNEDPSGNKKILIKRVIGLPGDIINIQDNEVNVNGKVLNEPYINDGGTPGYVKDYTVPKGEYFVMGDNRTVSVDSRRSEVGPVDRNRIVGKAIVRLYPFNSIEIIK